MARVRNLRRIDLYCPEYMTNATILIDQNHHSGQPHLVAHYEMGGLKGHGLGAPVASIGGAGTFDGIFLTGILAVLLASLYARPRAALAGWHSKAPTGTTGTAPLCLTLSKMTFS